MAILGKEVLKKYEKQQKFLKTLVVKRKKIQTDGKKLEKWKKVAVVEDIQTALNLIYGRER